MDLPERIETFGAIGEMIDGLSSSDIRKLAKQAEAENNWFTEESVRVSLRAIRHLLYRPSLEDWLSDFIEPEQPRVIGVAMAGNIPMVGFHDLLCVLISGNNLKTKLSSDDTILSRFIIDSLISIHKGFEKRIILSKDLGSIDAIIATGSDNTARYFEFSFRGLPSIIRKNRSSCAIITGEESSQELQLLGNDVFTYFGLGCRNVSKLYLPKGMDPRSLINEWEDFRPVIEHHKYANNYRYQKAVLATSNEKFIDGDFILLKEDSGLVSPLATLYFEHYEDIEDCKSRLQSHEQKIQLIASADAWFPGSIPFGKAQFPDVHDYADKVNTLSFLQSIK